MIVEKYRSRATYKYIGIGTKYEEAYATGFESPEL